MLDEQALCPNALLRLYKRTPRAARLAFVSAFLGGVLVYLFALTNLTLSTGDALTNVVFNGNLIWLGRWSSAWLSGLGTDLSMPLVNGLLMISAISLLAAFVVSFLHIKSSLCAVLCGLTLICFPSVGATLGYLHNADGYMIAAMLAVLSLLLMDNLRWGIVPAVPLLALAVGTYQANASLVIALMFVRAVQLILEGELQNKALLLRALRYFAYIALSLGLYYVLVGVFTRASGIALSDYQSVSDMGRFSLGTLWANLLGCYKDFKGSITFLSYRNDYYVSGYANYLYAAICAGLTGLVYALGRNKTVLKGVVLAALMLLSPMLLCSIRLFNPATVYSLMVYSVSCMYLLGLMLMERLPATLAQLEGCRLRPLAKKAMRLISVGASWALTACLTVCLFVWSVGTNVDFYRGKMDYESMYSQCSSYLTLAEAAEGYQPDMPIYVIGEIGGSNASRGAVALQMPKYFYAFMHYYLDVRMPYGIANSIDDEALRIRGTDAFAAMPVYPLEGCARVIDGAMVVKLSD